MKKSLSFSYYLFNLLLAIFLLILLLPIFLLTALSIKFTSGGSIMFKQKRVGHNRKEFIMYKFRTMIDGAEKMQKKYLNLNTASGPTFKISNDPRFTKIGKFLSHSNLDELPQIINVLKGDMFFVGFRPPIEEEVRKYKEPQLKRFEAYPGITSLWAISGAHSIPFNNWINMDLNYENERSMLNDIKIIFVTAFKPILFIIRQIRIL